MVEILTAGILILSTKGQCGCKAFIPAKQEADQIVDGRLRWTDLKKKADSGVNPAWLEWKPAATSTLYR